MSRRSKYDCVVGVKPKVMNYNIDGKKLTKIVQKLETIKLKKGLLPTERR